MLRVHCVLQQRDTTIGTNPKAAAAAAARAAAATAST